MRFLRHIIGPFIRLREANVADAQKLSALHGSVAAGHWSGSEYESLLYQRNVSAWIAEVALVGTRSVGMLIMRTAAGESEILIIAVKPMFQNMGIGYRLLHNASSVLWGQGVEQIFLEVSEKNARARSLYQVLGFEQISRRENYYPSKTENSAAIVMRKILP